MYRHSKSAFLQVTLNFELKFLDISSKYSNSNFAYHFIIYRSLFKV